MPSLKIDFEKLPIDVTDHILLYLKLLNISWPSVENDPDLAFDFRQVLWSLLVERELLGKNGYLPPLKNKVRIIDPDATFNYLITVRWDSPLVDCLTNESIPKNRRWIVDDFGSLSENPAPFNVVSIRGEGNYHLLVKDVRFFLEAFLVDNYITARL